MVGSGDMIGSHHHILSRLGCGGARVVVLIITIRALPPLVSALPGDLL